MVSGQQAVLITIVNCLEHSQLKRLLGCVRTAYTRQQDPLDVPLNAMTPSDILRPLLRPPTPSPPLLWLKWRSTFVARSADLSA